MSSNDSADRTPFPTTKREPTTGLHSNSNLSVLLVENTTAHAERFETVTHRMRSTSVELVRKETLADGLKAAKSQTFDLMVVDLNLPDSLGLETVRAAIDECPNTPIVVLSCENDLDMANQAIEMGAQYSLVKWEFGEDLLERVMLHAIQRHDFTHALQQVKQRLRSSEARFRRLCENNLDPLVVVDLRGEIRFVNSSAEHLFEQSMAQLVGRPFGIPTTGTGNLVEVNIPSSDGPQIAELRVADLRWEEEDVYLVSLRNITERKRLEDRLAFESHHDVLTGLPNRTFFRASLRRAFEKVKRNPNSNFAILFIDLDRFKLVNDSHGHGFGDRFLSAVADRVGLLTRPSDLLARFGGDEFVLLIEDISRPNQPASVAKRILHAFNRPFQIDDAQLYSSASIGVAVSTADVEHEDVILGQADTAMYEAKKEGGNAFRMFDEEVHRQVFGRLEMETDIFRAIEQAEFTPHFQPIVCLQTGRIVGVEALARWLHPTKGLLLPGTFLEIVEDTARIVTIGDTILQASVRAIGELNQNLKQADQIYVSINLSPRQLRDTNLLERIKTRLSVGKLEKKRLKFEISETVIGGERVHDVLSALKDAGYGLFLDDFGIGHSAFGQMRSFPIAAVKLDASFLTDIEVGASSDAVVQAIVNLARTLGLEVIAEGVETKEQLELVRLAGADFAQGFFFSKAVDSSQLEQLLSRSPFELTPLGGNS